MSLDQHKVIVGSRNTTIFEDPALGSNGTAIATKINSLIDELMNHSYKEVIGDGVETQYLVQHNLNSDVVVQLVNIPTGQYLESNISVIDTNTVLVETHTPLEVSSTKVLVLKV